MSNVSHGNRWGPDGCLVLIVFSLSYSCDRSEIRVVTGRQHTHSHRIVYSSPSCQGPQSLPPLFLPPAGLLASTHKVLSVLLVPSSRLLITVAASISAPTTSKKYEFSEVSAPRRRRLYTKATPDEPSASTSGSCHADESNLLNKENDNANDTKSTVRRSSRITPSSLLKRERALLRKEQEYKLRTEELDKRTQSISKREDEANALLASVEEREAETVLSQLEDHFTCALCVIDPFGTMHLLGFFQF